MKRKYELFAAVDVEKKDLGGKGSTDCLGELGEVRQHSSSLSFSEIVYPRPKDIKELKVEKTVSTDGFVDCPCGRASYRPFVSVIIAIL